MERDEDDSFLEEQNKASMFINRAVDGDKEAFADLYDIYNERIFRYVRYRVPSVEDAEDLTQLVFLRAYQAIDSYRSIGAPFAAWLFVIAHNTVISHYRRQRNNEELLNDVEQTEGEIGGVLGFGIHANPEVEMEIVLERERLYVMIAKLTPIEQRVLKMRFLEDVPHRNIAADLGKSEAAVRIIQFKALVKLRKALSESF